MKNTLLILFSGLVLAACSSKEHRSEKSASQYREGFNVQVEKSLPYESKLTLKYSGVVEASQNIPLSFATAGTISKVLVSESQKVKKGQLLATLDMVGAKNRLQLALQQQQRAQDAYDRMKPMKENGTLPEIQWVEIETGLEQATTAVAIAQQGIDDCYLYAPKDGIIGSESLEPGMNILPTVTIMELLDINTVNIKIPVPEDEIPTYKVGQSANIFIGALGKQVTGIVKEIGVSADFLSHTYPVKIEVSNADLAIKPGMVCRVTTTLPNDQSGVLISEKALQIDLNGKQFVFVHQNGKVEKREVKTNGTVRKHVLVSGELGSHEEVVVAGQQKLTEGMAVNVIR